MAVHLHSVEVKDRPVVHRGVQLQYGRGRNTRELERVPKVVRRGPQANAGLAELVIAGYAAVTGKVDGALWRGKVQRRFGLRGELGDLCCAQGLIPNGDVIDACCRE